MTPVLMGPCKTCWYLTGIWFIPDVKYEEFRSVLEKPRRTILIVRGTTLDEATAPGELDCEYCPFTDEIDSRMSRNIVANRITVVLIGIRTPSDYLCIKGLLCRGDYRSR